MDKKPQNWAKQLTLYVGFLINKNRKSNTIKSYISTIKAILYNGGIDLKVDELKLAALTKACKLTNDRVSETLPIRKNLLDVLLKQLDKLFLEKNPQPYLHQMYSAFFMTAYFGLFRIGELTSSQHVLKARDVFIATNKLKLMFVLYTSKTHSLGDKPQIIKISATRAKHFVDPIQAICPFTSLRNYLAIRRQRENDLEPFFVFQDGSPVKASNVRQILKKLLKKAGINYKRYNTSSFRAGCATDLYEYGISVKTIKKKWGGGSHLQFIHI